MIIYGLIVALMVTSVAYAVLQTTLTISGTVTKKGGSWNIYFANVSTPTLTGKAEMEKPSLTSANTNLTFSTVLVQPSDQAVFTVDVVNDGSLDAVLSTEPILDGLNAAKAEDINYTVVYADTGKAPAENDLLKSKETKTLKVTIQYDPTATSVSTSNKTLNLGLTLIYVQSDEQSSGGGGLELQETYVDGDPVYFNPVENKVCSDYTASQSNFGVKTGCMKWYAYNDTGSTVNLFLDHNTTNDVAWQSSGDNRDGIGEVQTQLLADTSTWDSGLNARLITIEEIRTLTRSGGCSEVTGTETIIGASWLSRGGDYWKHKP